MFQAHFTAKTNIQVRSNNMQSYINMQCGRHHHHYYSN